MGFSTHVWIPPTTELHRKEIELRVEQLRDVVGKNERWFESMDEVVNYLNDIGVRSTYGKRVSKQLLFKFRRKMAFPYARFGLRRTHVVTSNVLIMAWLWSMRVYRCTRANHPQKKDRADAIAHLVG